jgi:tRNA threonylcarbamoyladenosine biosynthesis protein TsaE
MLVPAIELFTDTVDDTRAAGEALAPLLEPGDVVSLTGELGAGKTAFVQGATTGLGITSPVMSPTFVLVRDYEEGRLPVHHADVYRLGTIQDAIDLGLDEMQDEGAVTFVEWGDAVEQLLTQDHLTVELTTADDVSDRRRIRIGSDGDAWARRWPAVERALAAWTGGAS